MDHLAYELLLARGVGFVVRRRRPVAGPCGRAWLPLEPAHDLLQPPHVRDDQLLAEAGAPKLGLDVTLRVLVLALQPSVQRDVGEHAAAEEVTERQRPPQVGGRDAVEAATQPGPEVDAL